MAINCTTIKNKQQITTYYEKHEPYCMSLIMYYEFELIVSKIEKFCSLSKLKCKCLEIKLYSLLN